MKHHSTIQPVRGQKAPTHEQISRRAEELWRKLGSPPDRDDEIWLDAERQLLTAPSATAVDSSEGPRRLRTGGPVAAFGAR